jgi:hypothetical protein
MEPKLDVVIVLECERRFTHAAFDMWLLAAEEHPSAMLIFEALMDPVLVLWQSHSSGCPVLKENAAVMPIWPSVKWHKLEAQR